MFDDDQDPVTSSRKWAIVLTFAGCAVSCACMALLIIVAAAVIMLRCAQFEWKTILPPSHRLWK